MNKDKINELLKSVIDDTDKIDDISNKILSEHNETVQDLAENKSQILDEKKKLQTRFKDIEEKLKEKESELLKFAEIDDIDKAKKALELMKSGKTVDGRNIDQEIEETVLNRTRSLLEEQAQYKSELEKINKEREKEKQDYIKSVRELDLTNKIRNSALKNEISEKMYDEYDSHIRRIFNQFDEDKEDYIAVGKDGRYIFRRVETTVPVNIETYTQDWLIPEKPFYKKNNNNPSMSGNLTTDNSYDNLFRMVGKTVKPTSKGYEYLAEKGKEQYDKAKLAFEKKSLS